MDDLGGMPRRLDSTVKAPQCKIVELEKCVGVDSQNDWRGCALSPQTDLRPCQDDANLRQKDPGSFYDNTRGLSFADCVGATPLSWGTRYFEYTGSSNAFPGVDTARSYTTNI